MKAAPTATNKLLRSSFPSHFSKMPRSTKKARARTAPPPPAPPSSKDLIEPPLPKGLAGLPVELALLIFNQVSIRLAFDACTDTFKLSKADLKRCRLVNRRLRNSASTVLWRHSKFDVTETKKKAQARRSLVRRAIQLFGQRQATRVEGLT